MQVEVPNSQEIQTWSKKFIGNVLAVPADKVDVTADFDRLGLDSTTLMSYLMTMEEWLGIELVPDIFFTHTTIASLSDHLASRVVTEQ